MIGVRSACLVILAEIKKIRGDFGADEIKTLFGKYNITPYTEKNCNDAEMSIVDFNEPGTYLPLFNATNKTKIIRWKDDEDSFTKEIQLKPGELTINPASKRMQGNVLIEIIFNGECIKKYKAKSNGYLLIQ